MGTTEELSTKDNKTCYDYYTIGSCYSASEVVQWEFFQEASSVSDDDQAFSAAQAAFVQFKASRLFSAVLFQNETPLHFTSAHILDVACILQAFSQESDRQKEAWWKRKNQNDDDNHEPPQTTTTTTVDRDAVEQSVAVGDAPTVPASYSPAVQWSLKRAMDVIFWRESVRFFSAGPYRYASRCFWDVQQHAGVRGHVALTFDDAPCRFANRANSRLAEVLEVLQEYNALATFMVVGKFISGDNGRQHEPDLVTLLQHGHELGNHGMTDRRHDQDSPAEFAAAVDECSQHIQALQKKAGVAERVQFFRAPHAKYTRPMERVLQERGLTNVMCDTFSSCPIVEDGEYVGSHLSRRAQDGSIILLHMPERGHRDWCMVALRRLLEGLQQRNLAAVTVGRLQELAEKTFV